MAIQYTLTLAAALSAEELAARAMPDPAQRPAGRPGLATADLYDSHGFALTVLTGKKNGYVEADSDMGVFEWEPADYSLVMFDLGPTDQLARPLAAMLTVVQRVLAGGGEDAVLVENDDVLLLKRFGGVLVKHGRPDFWEHYAGLDDLVR
ncbi:hypothetical protein J2S43_007947 [Catenuloplanes nepalensis]|uniref:Uncharacterized protein n=1 Tax=Catenuloplanes nepalensis TaxID=587533 RepID=A0ABT9N6V7_9ACTN|nr:SitI3 family protein [Catenuloplanes nepalensis]MDP9799435.1 hypothetical protein [Catenuloplanes nepalensis]